MGKAKAAVNADGKPMLVRCGFCDAERPLDEMQVVAIRIGDRTCPVYVCKTGKCAVLAETQAVRIWRKVD